VTHQEPSGQDPNGGTKKNVKKKLGPPAKVERRVLVLGLANWESKKKKNKGGKRVPSPNEGEESDSSIFPKKDKKRAGEGVE